MPGPSAFTFGMIEITELPGNRAVCVRQQGVQSAAKFGALSNALTQSASQRRWRILFDWAELEGWDDRRAFNLSCRKWSLSADTIVRASILHRSRWNCQAALLAAAFRVRGVQVRSWPLHHREEALRWLLS